MSVSLKSVALLMACLAVACSGRRVQDATHRSGPCAVAEKSNPVQTLADLLFLRQAGCAFFGPFAGPQTRLRYEGKVIDVPTGSSLMSAAQKLGIKVPTQCKKGECGTCTITVGTQPMRACSAQVPDPPRQPSLQEKGIPITIPRRR
mmetsp:Transcript_128864/g.223489  ORF Transcript_128864/g.223489 Transcript_128864/m.223489 type:complete len:147 (-) Transcript_128864:198-638(-)